jgi:mycoredoxin
MESPMSFVKMYSTDWCYDCKAMLSFFEEKNVAYKVIHVDNNPQAMEKLKQLCGGKKIVPTLEIDGKVYVNPSIDHMKAVVHPLIKPDSYSPSEKDE